MMLRALFGHDIFISYTRADAVNYAAALANHLASEDFSCFLDQWSEGPGEELSPSLKRAIRRSSVFVLIGTERSIKSKAVEAEVKEFLKTKRTFIPIDCDEVLARAPWYANIAGAARTPETKEALITGVPSSGVLNRIKDSFTFTRRNTRVRRLFRVGAVMLLMLFGVSLYAGITAKQQQDLADLATAEAQKQTQIAKESTTRAAEKEVLAQQNAAEADKQANLALKNLEKFQEQEKLAIKNAERAKQELARFTTEKINRESLELAGEASKLGSSNKTQSLPLAIQAGQLASKSKQKIPVDTARATIVRLIDDLFDEFSVRPSQIAADSAGEKIAIASPLGDSLLFNTRSGLRKPLCGHVYPISKLIFSPNGQYLISFSETDRLLQVWDANNGFRLSSSTVKGDVTTPSITISPDNSYLITQSPLHVMRLWKLPSVEMVGELTGTASHQGIVFHPSKPIFATYYSGVIPERNTLLLWNSATGQRIWAHDSNVSLEFLIYSNKGRSLIGLEPRRPPFDTPAFFLVLDLGEDGRPTTTKKIKYDEFDYKLLFDQRVPDFSEFSLRDTLGETLRQKYEPTGGFFNGILPNHNGSVVIGTHLQNSSPGPPVTIFSLEPPANLGPPIGWDGSDVDRLGFSPDDSLIAFKYQCATANCNSRIGIWSSSDRKPLWSRTRTFDDFQFSPDSTKLIVWNHDSETNKREMWLFDTRTGAEIRLQHDDLPITSTNAGRTDEQLSVVATDRSAKRLVTRTEHTLYVWNGEDGKLLVKESLFEKDKQRFKVDQDAISSSKELAELIRIATRRLNSCP